MIFMAGKGRGGAPIPAQQYGRGWYQPGRGKHTDMGFVYFSDVTQAPAPRWPWERAQRVDLSQPACHAPHCRPSYGYHTRECPEHVENRHG